MKIVKVVIDIGGKEIELTPEEFDKALEAEKPKEPSYPTLGDLVFRERWHQCPRQPVPYWPWEQIPITGDYASTCDRLVSC